MYETTTDTYSYHQFAFHKLSAIKLFDKNTDDATVGAVFNKFVVALRKYKHACWTLEAFFERTCITLIRSNIDPVSDLRWHTKRCDKFENQGRAFTSKHKIDAVLEY